MAALDSYDEIVVILESTKVPDAVKNHPKAKIWNITDPRVKNIDGVRETRDQIEPKIRTTLLK